jgi:hypothetical protein
MPKLGSQNLQQQQAGNFQFSGTRIEDLGATEYTLVTVVGDRSGSTSAFKQDMENALKEIVDACQKSPRADNLMLRLVTFDDYEKEEHGFKLLADIRKDDYNDVMTPGGMTALYDASCNGIEATNTYGRQLLEQDFSVNGIVFVITDGGDNRSKNGINQVKKALENAVSGENLESLVSILIGVNVQDPGLSKMLQDYHQQAGFTQYVELKDATKNTLAKLAQFVSKSVSSQSQALGSGGPSQSINF